MILYTTFELPSVYVDTEVNLKLATVSPIIFEVCKAFGIHSST